jgi:hypothetical protein
MTDDLRREDFLHIHRDLQQLWNAWRESRAANNSIEAFENCYLLMQLLASETRIWLFSRLSSRGELPRTIVPPRADCAFGSEVNFLNRLKHHPSMSALAVSRPDGSDRFISLASVLMLFNQYAEYSHSDLRGERVKLAFDQLAKDSHDTWLDSLELFVRFRNLDDHPTNQLDSRGAPIVITKRLKVFAPLIADAMGDWIPWMVRQAAIAFGSYKLRSKEEVAAENHFALHNLRVRQGFDLSSAHKWYVYYDEKGTPVELFARLETNEQISNVVKRLADDTESALFKSAARGRLLPLIGPAFGLPDQPYSPGAAEVLQRARDIVGEERFESVEEFLKSVIADRLNLPIPSLASASRQSCDTKARLAGELALLASHASRSFGNSLSASGLPPTGGSEALDPTEAGAISDRIADVSAAVRAFNKDILESNLIDLGADGIVDFLNWFGDEVRAGRLSLASVVRLADLVWHALRWDAPLYPDSEALDVQLWLGTPRLKDSRRPMYGRAPASSGAALLIEPPKLIDYLEGWSLRTELTIRNALIEARRKEWQAPHELVAKAMVLCLEVRQGVSPDSGGFGTKNVFVVDATFDQRMYEALEDAGAARAVVYPVDMVDNRGDKYPAWAIHRSLPVDNRDGLDEYSILWAGGRTIDKQDVPRVIVIKPFGAPLELTENLSDAAMKAKNLCPGPLHFEWPKNYISVKHRYLIDDVSILKDLVSTTDSMPPGFRDTLHSDYGNNPFELYFLGYALDEYGRRAHMLADVRPLEDRSLESTDRQYHTERQHYLSQPPPSGLVCLYLERAGIVQYSTSLRKAMEDLALRLGRYEREGKP